MANEIVEKIKDRYTSAVLEGDVDGATRIVDQGLAGGIVPSRLYLDVLMPSQVDIGNRWHRGEITIPEEHIATQITLRQMGRLRAMLKTRLKLGLKALVCSVEGDQHFIGAQAVADFLVVDGWEVDFLGADIPVDHLVPFTKAKGCHLVCVSVSLPSLEPVVRKLINSLRAIPAGPKIIIGGAAFGVKPDMIDSLAADGFARDPHEAVNLARHLCGVLDAENALAMFLRKLGHSVLEHRKLRSMSQQELATAADLDRAYISAVEHGKQNISIGAISKLARALEVSIEELLVGGDYR